MPVIGFQEETLFRAVENKIFFFGAIIISNCTGTINAENSLFCSMVPMPASFDIQQRINKKNPPDRKWN